MKLVLGTLFVPILVGNASADRRSFTNTYEYTTVPEGRTAVEMWHTESRDTWRASTPERYEQILEIEHGITDHWDAALYTVLNEVSASNPMVASPLALDSMRLETRYRFADRGEWPVDTLAYFEVSKDFGKSVYEIETKAVLARDFDRVTAAANLVGEIVTGHDVMVSEFVVGWAAGATYEVHPKCRIGAETWGQREAGTVMASVGPALSLAPSGNLWLTVTAGFGLNDAAPAFSGRAILGIEL